MEERKTYTKEEVIDLLLEERERAIRIAREFQTKHERDYKSKVNAGYEFAFIHKEIAETCRITANAISGLNALSIGETKRGLIEKKLRGAFQTKQ